MKDYDVIFEYPRTQAIEDGTLVDVSQLAKEAGFRFPVAITQGVSDLLTPNEAQERRGQSYDGRLWDVLNVLRYTIKSTREQTDRIEFKVLLHNRYTGKVQYAKLVSVCGPGDDAEPVLTVMLPDED